MLPYGASSHCYECQGYGGSHGDFLFDQTSSLASGDVIECRNKLTIAMIYLFKSPRHPVLHSCVAPQAIFAS